MTQYHISDPIFHKIHISDNLNTDDDIKYRQLQARERNFKVIFGMLVQIVL